MSGETLKPDIRLVAIDLDGTLLNDSKEVSEQTVNALCCLPQRGVRVVIASARPPRSVRHIYSKLKLDTWQINYNGALIWDEVNRRPVAHHPLPGTLVRQIIDEARRRHGDVLVTCEVLDRWFTDRDDQSYTTETGKLFQPDVIGPLDIICAQPVTKLMFLGNPPMLASLESHLAGVYANQVYMVRTDDHLFQVMDRRVSKGTALQFVASHYGISMAQVMAIGDAPNDVGMLQSAGVAIAMDNAHPLVKEVADWVARSNNDHGVHAALERFGLCS